jgi:hypothetical protein
MRRMVDPFVKGKSSENALVRHDPFLESHRQSSATLLPIQESLLLVRVPADTYRPRPRHRQTFPPKLSEWRHSVVPHRLPKYPLRLTIP